MNCNLLHGDCLELMKEVPTGSVDMILCDLPYGTTDCKWDSVIPFEPLWEQYNRIIKDNGAVVLFGTEPFSSYLRLSNIKNYRYDCIWKKSRFTNFLFVKKQFGRVTENISIFYKKQPTYNPQMVKGEPYKRVRTNKPKTYDLMKNPPMNNGGQNTTGDRYPTNILDFRFHNGGNYHPTQKPVPLLEYLIKTYTNPGETVLDNCMGSGSTGVACINTGRDFIGMELDDAYFEIAKKRIEEAANGVIV